MARISKDESMAGANVWMKLRADLLSKEGKEIVSADPDLSEETIRALLALLPEDRPKYEFYFYDDDEFDTGLTLVSSCIKDNLDASMAELVARYADMRRVPFAIAAEALNKLRKTKGLTYFKKIDDTRYTKVKWEPKSMVQYEKPPAKRRL